MSEETDKEERIFKMQSPSMQRLMRRPQAEDAEWQKRLDKPIENWRAVPNAKTWEEMVGARSLTFQETAQYEKMRLNRGAVLAQMRKEPDASSVDEAKRNRAINAFMFIKVKFKDLMKQWNMAPELTKVERHENRTQLSDGFIPKRGDSETD